MLHLVQNSPIFTINQLFSLSRQKGKQAKKPEQINHKNRCSEQKDYLSVKTPFGKRNESALRKFSDHIATSKREESQTHSKFQFLKKGKKDQSLHIKQISSRIIRNFSIKKVSQHKQTPETAKFKYLKKGKDLDCLSTCGLFKIKCCNCCGTQIDDFNQKFEQILKERGLWKKQQFEGTKEKKEQKEKKEEKLKKQIISNLAQRFSKEINLIEQVSLSKSELERKKIIRTQKTSSIESPIESVFKVSSPVQQQFNEISVFQKVQKMKQKLIKIENEYFEYFSKDQKSSKQSRILENGLLRWSRDVSNILKMQSLRKYKSYLQGQHYEFNEEATSSFFKQYKKSRLNSKDGDWSLFHPQQKLSKLRGHYQKNGDEKKLSVQRNTKLTICQNQNPASIVSNKQNEFNPKAVERMKDRNNSLVKNPKRLLKRVGQLQFLERKELKEIKEVSKGQHKKNATKRFQLTNQVQSRSDTSSDFSFSATSICDENGDKIKVKHKTQKTDVQQSEISIDAVSLSKVSIDTSQKQGIKKTRKQIKQNEGKKKAKRQGKHGKSKHLTSNSGQKSSQVQAIKEEFRSFKSIKKSYRFISSDKSFEDQDENEERLIKNNEKRIKKRRLGTIRKIDDQEEPAASENVKKFEKQMEKDIKLKKMISHLQEKGFSHLVINENETDSSLKTKISNIEKIIKESENPEFKKILALYVEMYRKNRGIKRREDDKELIQFDFNYVFRRELDNKNLKTFLNENFMGDQKRLIFYNLFKTEHKPPMEQQLEAIEIFEYSTKGRQIYLEHINLPHKQPQRVVEKPQNSKCFMKVLHVFKDPGELIQTSI